MRLLSWNLGCAYGQTYVRSQPRTWQQIAAWDPDVALVQETLVPPAWIDPSTYLFSPYPWSLDRPHAIGTAVYAPRHPILAGPGLRARRALAGASHDRARH